MIASALIFYDRPHGDHQDHLGQGRQPVYHDVNIVIDRRKLALL